MLPQSQMGARLGRSTTSALQLLTEQVRAAWSTEPAKIVSMLSLDISGAFDYVSHPRLIHNLRKAALPEWVIQFIQSFLTNRTSSLCFNDYTSPQLPTSTGIPQGSALSPILFLFFAGPLLTDLEDAGVDALGFVDDTSMIITGNSAQENCSKLETAHEICAKWARLHGAIFAPEKYSLIHFSRRRKVDLTAAVNIHGRMSQPEQSIRVLGVILDPKLKWVPHIQHTKAKAAKQMAALTRTTASTWGASFSRARQVYPAVIRPVLNY